MEAEYRSKMQALETAHSEAEMRLVQQQSDYESRLKVETASMKHVDSSCHFEQSLEEQQSMRVEEERRRAEEELRKAKQSEREKAEAEIQARQQELLDQHMRSQALLAAEKDKVSSNSACIIRGSQPE